MFLFEIPTGVVADTYSRRMSLIIGYLGMGIAWMAVALVSAPAAIIALWALWGLAYTFTSGAEEAWITDEVGVDNVGRVFLKGSRIAYIGSVGGLLLQVAIGVYSLRAGVIAGGAVTVLAGLLCLLFMPETGFRRRPRAERGSALSELRTTAVTRLPVRVGRAGDPAPGRRRLLHGHVERGVRSAEGGSLPAGHRAARGRQPRPGGLVRNLLARRDGAGVRRDGPAHQALRAGRPQGRHELALRPHGHPDGDDARVRPDRDDLARDRRDARRLPRPQPRRPALHDLAERADHRLERARDRALDLGAGGRDRPGRRWAGAGCDRQRLGHPCRAHRGRPRDRAGAVAVRPSDRPPGPRARARGAPGDQRFDPDTLPSSRLEATKPRASRPGLFAFKEAFSWRSRSSRRTGPLPARRPARTRSRR